MSKLILSGFIVLIGFSCLAVIDIGSDSPVFTRNVDKGEFLCEADLAYANSMADFSIGFLELLDGKSLTSSAKKHLVDSVRKCPEARLPIAILLGEWFKSGKYQECIDSFLPIANEHPEAIDLNLAVSSSMMLLKKNAEAASLLQKCFNTVLFPIENKESGKSVINLVVCLSDLYSRLNMFEEGEELFDKVLKDEILSKEYKIRVCAAVLFSLRADQGEDGFFSGWSKRRYRRKMDENIRVCEQIWDSALQTSDAGNAKLPSITDIVPLIEINRRYKLFENSERLLLNTLVFVPDNEIALRLLASVYDGWGQNGCTYRTWKKISQKNNMDQICYYELGRSAMAIRNFPEAAKSFEWLLLLNPDFNPIADYQLGISYFEMGKYDKAIPKFDKISDLPEAKLITALCLRNENRLKEAVASMEEAEKIAVSKKREDFLSIGFYLSFAAFCDKADMPQKAIAVLKKLTVKHPNDPETLNFLGYILAVNNTELDYAEKLIKSAIDKDGENPAYLDSMAWVFYKRSDYATAKYFIEKSIKAEKGSVDSVIADHAGDIYKSIGDRKNALKYWKMAAETYSPDVNPETVREKISSFGQAE